MKVPGAVKYEQEIMEGLMTGLSLPKVCEQLREQHDDAPTPWAIMMYRHRTPEYATKYDFAWEIGADVRFERLIDDANTPPPIVDGRIDQGWVSLQKVKINTTQWVLSKQKRKYSDRVMQEHSGTEGGPLTFAVRSILEQEPKDASIRLGK